MQLLRPADSEEHSYYDGAVTVSEFNFETDNSINDAEIVLTGRYPAESYAVNDVSTALVSVDKGTGTITIEGMKAQPIGTGDRILIKPGEPYYFTASGRLAIRYIATPAWNPSQAHTGDKPKKKEILDDNARKFIVEPIDPESLKKNGASSFLMVTDWLETGGDNEKKIVYKKFVNGDVQILLISKTTKGGRRTSEKEKIGEEEYAQLLGKSIRHLEKTRHEFEYIQAGIVFDIKYDEFTGSHLRILEVDAPTEEERKSFKPDDFPNELSEVTGEMQYYGHRVVSVT